MEESLETEYCREQWKFRKFDNAKCFQEDFLFREIESIPVKGGSCDIGNCTPKDIRNPGRVFKKKMEVLENGYIARFCRDI